MKLSTENLCTWQMKSTCDKLQCNSLYFCVCSVAKSLNETCSHGHRCTDSMCYRNCPPWEEWSLCFSGIQGRRRVCKCDFQSTEHYSWQKNASCWEERQCGPTEFYNINNTMSPGVWGIFIPSAVTISIVVFVIIATIIIFIMNQHRNAMEDKAAKTRAAITPKEEGNMATNATKKPAHCENYDK